MHLHIPNVYCIPMRHELLAPIWRHRYCPKIRPNSIPNHPHTVPKSIQNWSPIDPELTPPSLNRSQIDPKPTLNRQHIDPLCRHIGPTNSSYVYLYLCLYLYTYGHIRIHNVYIYVYIYIYNIVYTHTICYAIYLLWIVCVVCVNH